MKKISIVFMILLSCLVITGCGCTKKSEADRIYSLQEVEDKLKEYANDYFNKNIKDTVSFGSVTEYKLTLSDFASAGYDTKIFRELKDGEKCDAISTSATLKVQNNTLIDLSVRMACR